jgi:hypothetical protein
MQSSHFGNVPNYSISFTYWRLLLMEHNKHRRASLLLITLIAFVLLIALLLGSLVFALFLGSGQTQPGASHGTGSGGSDPPPVPPTHSYPHRSYRLYEFWFNPASPDFESAKKAIATFLEASCGIPNSEGFDADVGLLSANSFALPGISIHCPGVGSVPIYPVLTPTPVSCGSPPNPYDTSCQDSVDEANSTPIAQYTAQASQFTASQNEAKKEVRMGTVLLRTLEPHGLNLSTMDIYGAVKRSSYRFETTPPGSQYLIFVGSSLTNTTQINYTDTAPLYGARVFLLWWACNQVSSCAQTIDYWYSYFHQNGCSGDPRRFDPSRSIPLPAL